MKDIDKTPTKQFESITTDFLINVLGQTIKRDEVNKLITFLALLSAYTEDSQLNISFNAPSSSGKSFIPLEVSQLFPKEDIIKLGSASATAFYHEQGIYDKERNAIIVDLSRKIIIFLDQPSNQLLGRLRALLSHDEKEIHAKITDKNQKGGNRTKTVILLGFPVVIFCTAGLSIDEQEATRFLLLSPEISQEKLRESIYEKIRKESSISQYRELVETDPARTKLIERIRAIKELHINEIRIGAKNIYDLVSERITLFKPRHQRDIGRILNLVKIFALLNVWNRKEIDGAIYADESDVEEAFKLWDVISESQELNLPPYVLNLYKDIIIPAYEKKNSERDSETSIGLTKKDIGQKHFEIYGRFIPDWQLRQQILPMLETAGLISQDLDHNDKRVVLVYPTVSLTVSEAQNNSEPQGGVSKEEVH